MKWKPQVSLLSVLLMVTVVALAVPLWKLGRESQKQKAELTTLRNEAGYLTIDDASKLQAIRVKTGNPLIWRWKLHLPAEKDFFLLAFVGDLPPKGQLPDVRSGLIRLPGPPWKHRVHEPQIVEIAIIRDVEGKLVLRHAFGGISSQHELSDEQQLLFTEAGMSVDDGVRAETKSTEPGKDLVLLNNHRRPKSQSSKARRGIMVWVEEIHYVTTN